MKARPLEILDAAKATAIPEGEAGLWRVDKVTFDGYVPGFYGHSLVSCPPGTYTYLRRATMGTLHKEPPGEIVMEDTPHELQTHLNFMLRASGDVLVTGLGLGCVVRGLLANPNVSTVTCVENSESVLRLVEPHLKSDRLVIVHADALEWTKQNSQPFDFAWHDIWSNREDGEPHLDHCHAHLLVNCRKNVGLQGAWSFDRSLRKFMKMKGMRLL